MNGFKDNLQYYRKQSGLTQKQLAEKLGVSQNNIGHYEKGRTEPSIDTILLICKILSVTLEELLVK